MIFGSVGFILIMLPSLLSRKGLGISEFSFGIGAVGGNSYSYFDGDGQVIENLNNYVGPMPIYRVLQDKLGGKYGYEESSGPLPRAKAPNPLPKVDLDNFGERLYPISVEGNLENGVIHNGESLPITINVSIEDQFKYGIANATPINNIDEGEPIFITINQAPNFIYSDNPQQIGFLSRNGPVSGKFVVSPKETALGQQTVGFRITVGGIDMPIYFASMTVTPLSGVDPYIWSILSDIGKPLGGIIAAVSSVAALVVAIQGTQKRQKMKVNKPLIKRQGRKGKH